MIQIILFTHCFRLNYMSKSGIKCRPYQKFRKSRLVSEIIEILKMFDIKKIVK